MGGHRPDQAELPDKIWVFVSGGLRLPLVRSGAAPLALSVARGKLFADGALAYVANDLRVGMIRPV